MLSYSIAEIAEIAENIDFSCSYRTYRLFYQDDRVELRSLVFYYINLLYKLGYIDF